MIRFFVFSDLHYDEVDDGDKRIEDILSCAEKRNPDFILTFNKKSSKEHIFHG